MGIQMTARVWAALKLCHCRSPVTTATSPTLNSSKEQAHQAAAAVILCDEQLEEPAEMISIDEGTDFPVESIADDEQNDVPEAAIFDDVQLQVPAGAIVDDEMETVDSAIEKEESEQSSHKSSAAIIEISEVSFPNITLKCVNINCKS